MFVEFSKIKAGWLELEDDLNQSFNNVVNDGFYIGGKFLDKFEKKYSSYCDSTYCVGVSSGLDALILSLKSLNIGQGDEVIVPANTYIASWLAITHCGANPIPIEPDPISYNIDLKLIENYITKKTKAIMLVYLYGHVVDIERVKSLAKKFKLKIIIDAAQAHGALYNKKQIGSHGDVVCWSFYPGKNLGAMGDAGAITTNNSKIALNVRSMRNYGSNKKYVNSLRGFNNRLDSIQAAFLLKKLKKLKKWNQLRKKIANFYLEELKSLDLILPSEINYCSHAWHLFVIRLKNRNKFQEFLSNNQIQTLIHYPIPPHKQKCYGQLNLKRFDLSLTELISKTIISLPISPHHSEIEIEYVIENVKKWFRKR